MTRGINVVVEESLLCLGKRETLDYVLLKCHFAVEILKHVGKRCGWHEVLGEPIRDQVDWYYDVSGS